MLKNFVERLLGNPYLLDAVDDGGGGGGTPDSGTPGADNDSKPQPGGEDGKKVVADNARPAPQDDRHLRGVMAELKKEREARQKFERDYTTTQSELARERKRIAALAGIDGPSNEDKDAELVKRRIAQLYPALEGLDPADVEGLKEIRAELAELRAHRDAQGVQYGKRTLDAVAGAFQKALGGKLSERQDRRIREAYITAAANDESFLARHDAGDPTLVDEFVRGYVEDFVEPARRRVLAEETSRMRRVPRGGDRTIPGSGQKPIDVNDPKAVEDLLVKGFRERGGQFGR